MASETEKKKQFYRREKRPICSYNDYVHIFENKYFNLFRANYKWTGLNYRQEDYIMRKFWGLGTVFAFNIKPINELGFAPWTLETWDMYHLPETVNLINEMGSPLIPVNSQIVDKDGCIGYIQRNKKPLWTFVKWYCERIAQVEMVINTNLQLHKMPYLIPTEENADKIEDITRRILNNELVICSEGVDPTIFKAVSTQVPYIIDKLHEYKVGLENELKTFLGVDNQGPVEKREQLQLDEINAGNDEINDYGNQYLDCLKEFCINIKEVLGHDISVEPTSRPVDSIGEVHSGEKPGPEEGSENAE